MEECKRCLLREAAQDDTFRDIQTRIEKLSPGDKADEDLYRTRLDACRDCDHLISGICMKCGCYVEFRAAFRKMKCPNAADRKW
ncbi:MAG: hypothetical protein IJC71_02655 [Clostridia bacterium]|nr:hypothetical protein [Clostridia bacterium]